MLATGRNRSLEVQVSIIQQMMPNGITRVMFASFGAMECIHALNRIKTFSDCLSGPIVTVGTVP